MKKIESKNGIIGVAIGDAMGLPIQFMERSNFIDNPVTEMLGHMCFNMPKGSWSDDTSMTLATMDAIIKDGEINSTTIMDNFVKWVNNNEFTPTGEAYDMGRTCLKAIINYSRGIQADEAGLKSEYDNGNGSLMRIMPMVYYCFSKEMGKEEIYKAVKQVSSLTHAHEISVLGCFIYVLFGISILNGDSLEKAYQTIQQIEYGKYFSEEAIARYSRILEGNIKDVPADDISSSGFVLHTLEATFWALLNTDSFDSAIIKVINLGDDSDSTGACVGGPAGAYYGIDTINSEWKKDLIKYDYIEDLCAKFDEVLNK